MYIIFVDCKFVFKCYYHFIFNENYSKQLIFDQIRNILYFYIPYNKISIEYNKNKLRNYCLKI